MHQSTMFRLGKEAFKTASRDVRCPYERNSYAAKEWAAGWHEAAMEELRGDRATPNSGQSTADSRPEPGYTG